MFFFVAAHSTNKYAYLSHSLQYYYVFVINMWINARRIICSTFFFSKPNVQDIFEFFKVFQMSFFKVNTNLIEVVPKTISGKWQNKVQTISYIHFYPISAIVNNYSAMCISTFSNQPIYNNVCLRNFICVVSKVSRD